MRGHLFEPPAREYHPSPNSTLRFLRSRLGLECASKQTLFVFRDLELSSCGWQWINSTRRLFGETNAHATAPPLRGRAILDSCCVHPIWISVTIGSSS